MMADKELTKQQKATRKWYKKHKEESLASNRMYNATHKERRDYTNGRSFAKNFISNLGKTEDLQEVDALIHQRLAQLKEQ